MPSHTPETQARDLAQFFFEMGFGACYAEAIVRNGNQVPFPLSDAEIERQWAISQEAYDDADELEAMLSLARHRQSSSNAGGVDVGAIRRDEHRVRGSSAPNYCTPYGPAARALSAALDALKPFAEVADCYDDREDDSFEVWVDAGPERNIRASFKLAHYRKARAALASLSTPTAEPAICQECDPPGSGNECRGGDCYSCGGTGRTPPTPDRIGKDAVREAVADLLAHRVGDVPGQGWLRDNDQSRAALAKLAALTDTKGDRPMGDR